MICIGIWTFGTGAPMRVQVVHAPRLTTPIGAPVTALVTLILLSTALDVYAFVQFTKDPDATGYTPADGKNACPPLGLVGVAGIWTTPIRLFNGAGTVS